MKQFYAVCFLIFSTLCVSAQNIERIEVRGKIVVNSTELEGITIYNTSSNKGTITDEEGNYSIKVAENDVLEFSALQFSDFTTTITADIIKSKQMVVKLVEEVNQLDEVVVLPYGLTGFIDVDAPDVKTFYVDSEKEFLGYDNETAYEFADDYKSEVRNEAIDDQMPYMDNGLNIIAIGKELFNLFKKKKTKEELAETEIIFKDKKYEERLEVDVKTQDKLFYKYDNEYLSTNFNIPEKEVTKFINIIEEKPIKLSLLDRKNEIKLLEYINKESQLFVLTLSDED